MSLTGGRPPQPVAAGPDIPARAVHPAWDAAAARLDGALRAVAAEPHGGWVLAVVAVGLGHPRVNCLARARHPVG